MQLARIVGKAQFEKLESALKYSQFRSKDIDVFQTGLGNLNRMSAIECYNIVSTAWTERRLENVLERQKGLAALHSQLKIQSTALIAAVALGELVFPGSKLWLLEIRSQVLIKAMQILQRLRSALLKNFELFLKP
jgi:hypothetical protein